MGDHVTFALGMLACLVMGRMNLLAMRGRLPTPSGFFESCAAFGLYALAIWGFIALEWWFALGTIIVSIIIGGFIVHPRLFEFWYRASTPLAIFITATMVWLWAVRWPF